MDQLQNIGDFIAAFVDTDQIIADTYAKYGKKSQTREYAWQLGDRGQAMMHRLRPPIRPRRIERVIAHADPKPAYVPLAALSAA